MSQKVCLLRRDRDTLCDHRDALNLAGGSTVAMGTRAHAA
jgi:hypothetical protein